MYILLVVLSIIQAIVVLFGFYHGFISIFGLLPHKKPSYGEPCKKFAIVIPAHNEEQVIEGVIHSINNQNYPKELYSIMVICDNCTDNTAEIVRQNQALAFERYNTVEKGKGYALKWMFEKIYQSEEEFHAIVVLDADNIVSANFLQTMNDMLGKDYRIIQGYLDSKNPDDSWVTLSYAIAYWFMGRMWQLARFRLGLPNALGGTGMCFEINTLEELGWDATSLTEDLEFTMKAVLHGERPVWAHHAIVYDEKPIEFQASWRQRLRWMRGHWTVAFAYIKPLFIRLITKRDIKALDSILYLLQPSRILLAYFCLCVNIILALTSYGYVFSWLNSGVIFPRYVWITLFIIQWIIPPGVILIMLLERVKIKRFFGLIWYQFFALSYLPLTFIGLFTRKNKDWSHTSHSRKINFNHDGNLQEVELISDPLKKVHAIKEDKIFNRNGKGHKDKFAYIAYLTAIVAIAFIVNGRATNTQATYNNESIIHGEAFFNSESIKQKFIRSETEATEESWLDYPIVAHALGSIDGHRATNSLDAMAVNYIEKNMRVFEVDLILTSDDRLVARHDWLPYLYDLLGQTRIKGKKSGPLSYADFMSLYSFGKYEPMDIDKLVSILQKHQDIYIITDTKYTDAKTISKQFHTLVDAVKDVDVSILDRLVIQIYNREMYDVVNEIHPFKNTIYAIYANSDSQNDVIEFCKNKRISAVAIPIEELNLQYIEGLNQNNIKVYVHTVNTVREKDNYKNMGVWGIYSDYLTGIW